MKRAMDRTYPNRPWIGVGVVVYREDQVLLIQRGKPPRIGQWSLPGGVQEVGETVREAAHREVMEETGVEIELLGLVDVIDSMRHDDAGRVHFHYTLVDMAAEWRAGEPRGGDDAMGAKWVPIAEIEDHLDWTETLRVIREGLALRRS